MALSLEVSTHPQTTIGSLGEGREKFANKNKLLILSTNFVIRMIIQINSVWLSLHSGLKLQYSKQRRTFHVVVPVLTKIQSIYLIIFVAVFERTNLVSREVSSNTHSSYSPSVCSSYRIRGLTRLWAYKA